VIDLHCHILPGIDDGPEDLVGSIELARAAVAAGITTTVATPHVSASYPNRPAEIARLLSQLRAEIAREGIPLTVLPGAELSARAVGALTDGELAASRLGDGPWLLLECPLSRVEGFSEAALALKGRGFEVLLAHPERSPLFRSDPSALEELVAAGMLCSITAGSLTGRFGETIQDFALTLAEEDLVHNVVSDAHNTARRPPGALTELAQTALAPLARWLTEQVPAALLAGAAVPPRPG